VTSIVVTPQEANRASCRVLEKSGYRLVWTGMLDSDHPSDAGTAAMYLLDRPSRPPDSTDRASRSWLDEPS
jgi:RimJ/RimL family protein N-acetyltransferase